MLKSRPRLDNATSRTIFIRSSFVTSFEYDGSDSAIVSASGIEPMQAA
jgi:hypothetical protein